MCYSKNNKMKFILISVVISLVSSSPLQDVARRFRSYDVVVDILDEAPESFLDITYPGDIKITFGRVLKVNEVQTQPEVTWTPDPNAFYTLMMVDPDEPSYPQPTNRSIKRWLVGNIQGNDVKTGDVLATYSGPQPLVGTGLHRYIFLLYKHNEKINFNEPQTEEARLHFNVRDFMKKYNLGNPIAGNLFESRAESK